MDLSSPSFIFIFLPVFLSFYLFARTSARLPLILIANVVFIVVGQYFALFPLLGIVLLGYSFGRIIESKKNRGERVSFWVWLGVGLILGFLITYKLLGSYAFPSFFIEIFPLDTFVPLLGLSYITFQTISYLIDVSRNTISAEVRFIEFSTYLLFFPKLISGPITRYKPFGDQISELAPSTSDVAIGLRRVLLGVVKRSLLAGQLGIVADSVFALPITAVEPRFAWLGLMAYTFQIYFDFSGYSDMALGLGKAIGVTLPENFRDPYIAQSIADFWRRWHISLSTWFRDYVFYPLERQKLMILDQRVNLLVVFILTGLWHGFTLNFLSWGLLHGAAMAFESAGGGRWLRIAWRPVRHLYVTIVVLLGWVFFRSPEMNFAFDFLARLLGVTRHVSSLAFSQTSPLPIIEPSFLFTLIVAGLFSLPTWIVRKRLLDILEAGNQAYAVFFQVVEDVVLIGLFVLAIAAQFGGAFQPNIYAGF